MAVQIAGLEEAAASSESGASQEMWDIVRHHRNRAEIFETECEQLKLEINRLTQQRNHLQKQLAQTREQLNVQRERSSEQALTAAKHRELMEKVERLTMVEDSNRLLRKDLEDANERRQDVEKKYLEATVRLNPLKERVKQMEQQVAVLREEKLNAEKAEQTCQQRVQALLNMYNSISPEEIKQLRETQTVLESTKALLEEENKELREAKEATEKELRAEVAALKKSLSKKESDAKGQDELVKKLRQFGRRSKEENQNLEARLKEAEQNKTQQAHALQEELNQVKERLEVSNKSLAEHVHIVEEHKKLQAKFNKVCVCVCLCMCACAFFCVRVPLFLSPPPSLSLFLFLFWLIPYFHFVDCSLPRRRVRLQLHGTRPRRRTRSSRPSCRSRSSRHPVPVRRPTPRTSCASAS